MPSEPAPRTVELPPGLVVVTTYGAITPETSQCLMDLQAHNFRSGLTNIQYTFVTGTLVDKARNEAAKILLQNPTLQYLLFIDADMTFGKEILQHLLQTAYDPQWAPWADAVGAYCPLRGAPYLPTIDTGTGTWEPHDPGMGALEVIRTGSACILVKRHVYERMEYPWYGIRHAPRALDTLAEFDNYARTKFDGRNLLREHPGWAQLERCALEDARRVQAAPVSALSSVGEDSNFCDRMKALGFRIVVQTNAVCGHLEHRLITPDLHTQAMKDGERLTRLASGVLE